MAVFLNDARVELPTLELISCYMVEKGTQMLISLSSLFSDMFQFKYLKSHATAEMTEQTQRRAIKSVLVIISDKKNVF